MPPFVLRVLKKTGLDKDWGKQGLGWRKTGVDRSEGGGEELV